MKTYVLTVSSKFPATHKRRGESTGFAESIGTAKIHTIRGNLGLWQKRAEAINSGKAVLSVRYWSGRPYNSKQVEICSLSKISVQGFYFSANKTNAFIDGKAVFIETVAYNDGLTLCDFLDWFKGGASNEPMAVIHFTDFIYF